MNIKKKGQLCLLLFLFFLILFFQYPRTEHMIGNDSFQNLGMSRAILDSGEMYWALHPSSIFGLYPFSYPSGVQIIAAVISGVTGIRLELSYLLLSAAMVFIGSFGMFMLAGEINRQFLFKFFAAFSFSITPVVFKYSTWNTSTRGPFILLLPLFLYLALKTIRSVRKAASVLATFLLFFALLTIHHLALLLPLLVLAILVSYMLTIFLNKVRMLSPYWPEISRTISLTLFIFILFLFYLQFLEISQYHPDKYIFSAWFLYGDEPHIMIMNGLIYYTISIGGIIIFLGLGVGRMVEKIDKNAGEWSLLFFLLLYGNFLLDIKYMVAFMVPLLIPFISIGIYESLRRIKKQKLRALFLVFLIILLSILQSGYVYSKLHDMDFQRKYGSTGTVTVREKTYNSIVYADYLNMNMIVNDLLLQRRLLGYTGNHVMPFESFEIAEIEPDYVKNLTIKRYEIMEMYEENHDQLWYVENLPSSDYLDPTRVFNIIVTKPIYFEGTKENLSRFEIRYAVSCDLLQVEGKTGYTGVEMRPPYRFSPFFYSLQENRYLFYRNEFQSFYWLL